MAQSMNRSVDLTIKGQSMMGLGKYGHIMIGDEAFEFYNERDVNDYIQIPWEQVDLVIAEVIRNGKWIPRFVLRTKDNVDFPFSTKDNKKTLRAIHKYIPGDRMVRSLSFGQVVSRGIKNRFNKNR